MLYPILKDFIDSCNEQDERGLEGLIAKQNGEAQLEQPNKKRPPKKR